MARTPWQIAGDLLDLYVNLSRLRVLEAIREPAELAHAWYGRAGHTTQAIKLLHTQGYVTEAAPLRRTLIEHALALQWIGHSPGPAYDAKVKEHHYQVDKFSEKPGTSGAIPREVIDWLATAEIDGGVEQNLNHTYELCKKYGPPGAYTAWFYETGGSHPSWRSGVAYRTGRSTESAVDDAMVVVWFALATAGFSLLIEGDPWAGAAAAADRELAEYPPLREHLARARTDDAQP